MTQDQAFDILALGQNVFLTGAAGTGKTYLLNRFIRHCHEHGIVIAVTASTGIAATHISGVTIHSWSGLGVRDSLTDDDIDDITSKEYLMKRFIATSVLIIDEISMLSSGFLSSLDLLLRKARFSPLPFGGIQMIFVGDFFQLPPVVRGSSFSELAFEDTVWKNAKILPCVLTTQYRQNTETEDAGLLSILSEIRLGRVSSRSRELLMSRNIPVTTDDHTELFTRNISVDAYNEERLNQIHDDTFIFEMQTKGSERLVETLKKGCLAPETLVLKIGARVMFVKNNFEAGYANGSIGHVVARFEGLPVVELLDGTKIIADFQEWGVEENGKIKASLSQVPLRLAWAITVHKSQGMTLDTAVIDLRDAFVLGQGYVALSRVRSLSGLILKGFNTTALQVDPRVIEYEKALLAASEKVENRIREMPESEKIQKQHYTIRRLGGVIEKLEVSPKGKKSPKISTHEETYGFILSGLSLEDIAIERNLKISTIVSHIEKLLEDGKSLDLAKLRPLDEDRLSQILGAFRILATKNLAPIKEYLYETYDEEYDYDEIRLARLFS